MFMTESQILRGMDALGVTWGVENVVAMISVMEGNPVEGGPEIRVKENAKAIHVYVLWPRRFQVPPPGTSPLGRAEYEMMHEQICAAFQAVCPEDVSWLQAVYPLVKPNEAWEEAKPWKEWCTENAREGA